MQKAVFMYVAAVTQRGNVYFNFISEIQQVLCIILIYIITLKREGRAGAEGAIIKPIAAVTELFCMYQLF